MIGLNGNFFVTKICASSLIYEKSLTFSGTSERN